MSETKKIKYSADPKGYMREYRKRNSERLKKKELEYYENNAEKIRKRANDWYYANKERADSSNAANYLKNRKREISRQQARRELHIGFINEWKESFGCQECNKERHPGCLDLHHIDPSQKDRKISQIASRSLENIKKELAKCVVLCANCHRKLHYMEGNGQEFSNRWKKNFREGA